MEAHCRNDIYCESILPQKGIETIVEVLLFVVVAGTENEISIIV
jgi:hypothetical protein